MTDRPRVAVIVYGSILDPDDLAELFDNIQERAIPIMISGFTRVFNQEASWRETKGDQMAVLNVIRADEGQFNGVLVTDLSRAEFQEFRKRERGYRLVEVESHEINSYDSANIEAEVVSNRPDIETQDLILTTTGTKTRSDISPINSYVKLCRDGAKQWGEEFLQDFLETTKLNSGISLNTYISEE